MSIIEYFEAVRTAYAEDDQERVKELTEKEGNKEVKLAEVEELVSYVTQILAGYQVALENKEQIHFDMIVNMLESTGALSEDSADALRDEDEELDRRIKGAVNND